MRFFFTFLFTSAVFALTLYLCYSVGVLRAVTIMLVSGSALILFLFWVALRNINKD